VQKCVNHRSCSLGWCVGLAKAVGGGNMACSHITLGSLVIISELD